MLADAMAASLLHEAHRLGRPCACLPADCRPRAAEDGYRIQERLVDLLGTGTAGWKVRSTAVVASLLRGDGGPFAARLLEDAVTQAPASLTLDGDVAITIEAELGFRMGFDLPASGVPYSAATILGAVDSVHPVLEVYESRFDRWVEAGLAGMIADNGIDSRLVVGPGVAMTRCPDPGRLWIAVNVNAAPLAAGPGNHVLGTPVALLCWLVNGHLRTRCGLRAGELVAAGSFTGILTVRAGDRVHATFGPLGEITLATLDASRA